MEWLRQLIWEALASIVVDLKQHRTRLIDMIFAGEAPV